MQEQKQKQKLHKILITVLIPLIMGILMTTLLSVLIILILSPYWAQLGGNSLINQQYVFQSGINFQFNQTSCFKCVWKFTTTNYAKNIYFQNINNATILEFHQFQLIGLNLSFYKDPIFSSQVIEIINSNLFYMNTPSNQIENYDSVRQNCAYCMGWGLYQNTTLQPQIQYSQLNNTLQQKMQAFSSTYYMLQSIYLQNQDIFLYCFFHSVDGLFFQYPYTLTSLINQSPLEKMRQNYSIQNTSTLFRWQIVNEPSSNVEQCFAVINGQIYEGIICLGIDTLGLEIFMELMMNEFQLIGSSYSFIFDKQLSVFASSAINLTRIDETGVNHIYPSLYDLLFDNTYAQLNFYRMFYDILYPTNSSNYILLYSGDYFNDYNQDMIVTFQQVIQAELGVFNNASIDSFILESAFMIQFEKDIYTQALSSISNSVQNSTFLNIMTIAIPISIIMCLAAWCISFRIIQSVSKPISDLEHKLEIITQDSMAIQIYSNFQQSSLEVNKLYDSFDQLVTVLNFSNDRYFEGDDTSLLIKYAQGYLLFQKMRSNKGMGMILNNIGNIHRRQSRYIEAIQSYRQSLSLCEFEIIAITGMNINELYPLNKSQKHIASAFDFQRTRTISTNKLQLYQDRDGLLSLYDDIYCSRSYQLASLLMEFSQNVLQTKEDKKPFLSESADLIRRLLQIDEKYKKNLYRKIMARLLLCRILLYLGEFEKAKDERENIEQLYDEYEDKYEQYQSDKNDNQSVFSVHPGILKQRILYEKGLFCVRIKRFKSAAKLFTEALETSKFYDPEIRQNCLQQLLNIFKNNNLPTQRIEELLSKSMQKKHKDIVFAMDFSGSMENIKKDEAIKGILKIFDQYLQDHDRIGFIRFNQSIEVVFELTQKNQNTAYLRNSINKTLQLTASGKTALLQAICHSYALFERSNIDNQKWVVVLCDGEDNLSNMTQEKMKKFMQKRPDISIIIIGIGLTSETLDELYDLVRFSKNGFLIESILNEDLDVAFQSLGNLLFGQGASYDERLT